MSQKIEQYLKTIANQNPRTATVFGSHLRDFDRLNVGKTDKAIQEMKKDPLLVYNVLNDFVGFLNKKGTMSGKSIGYSVKTARRFLEFHDIDIVQRKFQTKVKVPKAKKFRPSPLKKTDIIKIINGLPDIRLKTYIMFLASSGCRAEEALSVALSDIDLKQNPITVRIDGNYTKTQEDRFVWLTEEMKKQLNVWLEYRYRPRTIRSKKSDSWTEKRLNPVQHPDDLIFLPYGHKRSADKNETRRQLKNAYYPLYEQFKATVKRLGYPKVSFHSMRRFVYTSIDSLGQNQYAEYYLGHSNSEYWAKHEDDKLQTFRVIEPYLTYTDTEALEARTATIHELEKQIAEMKHRSEGDHRTIESLVFLVSQIRKSNPDVDREFRKAEAGRQ